VRRLAPLPLALAVTVALATTGCAGTSGGTSGSQDKTPIKIGQIASLTGNYQPLGSEDKKAVALAVDQINTKGGLLGRKVEIIVKDDQSQPDQSVLAWGQLKDAGVAAVIGSPFSNSALATIPRVDRDKIPYLSLTPADEQVDPVHPYVFVVPATSATYADRMLQYLQATALTKIAVAYDTKSSYATAGFKGMQTKASHYGITLTNPQEFQTTTTDFSAVFTHLRTSGAQALAVWATGPPAVALTKQYATANLPQPLILTGAQASPLFLQPAGPAAEDVTILSAVGVVGPALPAGPLKTAVDELTTTYQTSYGNPPPQFAQDGYSGAKLLFAAITKAKTATPDKIRNALDQLTLTTPNGTYHYTPTNHAGLSKEFISVNTVKTGTLTPTDWAKTQLATLTGN
jgi:branched-chain amino acid transport system substrate-binding protein